MLETGQQLSNIARLSDSFLYTTTFLKTGNTTASLKGVLTTTQAQSPDSSLEIFTKQKDRHPNHKGQSQYCEEHYPLPQNQKNQTLWINLARNTLSYLNRDLPT